jgi:hypothetical protein
MNQHLRPASPEKERVMRDLQQLSISYRFLNNKQDDVSRRILLNLDPDIITMLKADNKDHDQVINPL